VLKKSSKVKKPVSSTSAIRSERWEVQARLRHAAKPEKLDDLRIGELEIRASSG
jgi:hypothetical protein